MSGSAATSLPDDSDPGTALMRSFVEEFVERPSPELDAALDAAAQCFTRHGLAHTSVPDIARELGVSKATVYRQVGSVDDAVRLLLARDLHNLVDELTAGLAGQHGPDAVIQLALVVTRHAADNPLLTKMLVDEPNVVGELLPHLPMAVRRCAAITSPYFAALMSSGEIRTGDSDALADLVVRLAAIAVLVPPPDLDSYFRTALLPHLQP